jgi:hypothetical protein
MHDERLKRDRGNGKLKFAPVQFGLVVATGLKLVGGGGGGVIKSWGNGGQVGTFTTRSRQA